MSRFFVFLIVLIAIKAVLLPEIGFSQSSNLGMPPVLNYTKRDFKGGTQVWDIAQDDNGYVWFGNNAGLLEFDGVHWRLHALPNRTIVRSVLAGQKGDVFVGGQDEFGYFQPQADGSMEYFSLRQLLPPEDQQIGDVWKIVENEFGVFFRCPNQVFRFYNNKLTTLFPRGTQVYFLGEWQGQVLFQLGDFKLFTFNQQGLVPMSSPGEFNQGAISGLLQFSPDTMLLTTIKNGIFYFNGSEFVPWKTQDDTFLKKNTIFFARMLKDGKIAIATSYNGLVVIDRHRRVFNHVNKKSGLQNNTVLCVYPDKSKGLWLGLDNGIDYVDIHSPISTLFPDGDLQGTGYTAQIFDGKIYFGTNTGLYGIDWKTYYTPEDRYNFNKVQASEGQVWSLNEMGNRLLMGHHEGAFEINGLAARKLTSLQGVWKFIQISENKAIAGHYNGLADFHRGAAGWVFDSTRSNLMESSRLLAKSGAEEIWMAHPYRGIYKIQLPAFQTEFLGKKDGLPSDLGNHLFQLNSQLVFAGEKGVFDFDRNQNRFVHEERFEKIFGANTKVRYLKQDQDGNIWYVTNHETGILVVENHALGKQVFKMPIPELHEKLTAGFQFILPVNDENAFLATEKGFIHFNLRAYLQKDTQISVVLQEVRLKSGPDSILWGGHKPLGQKKGSKIGLTAGQNAITFSFSALSFHGNELVSYSHFLEGADEEWSPWAHETDVHYTNLRPGSYRFKVRARNKFGIESKETVFEFVINPPWYASKLAYFLYFLGFIALIAAIIYRQEKAFDKEKEGLVILHDLQTRNSEEAINKLLHEKLEAEVKHKNRELASATLHLVQKNEILNIVKEGLEKLKAGAVSNAKLEKEVILLIKMLEQDARTDADWELFSQRFDQVHSDFLKRLGEQHAHLSPNDYKLCAYLRLNMSSKEIATLMNISLRGVESSRYRLRKRLGLDSEENLTEFLMRL